MKVFIIGIDGATWNIIDPLLEQGRLPNLARLIQGGTRVLLRSIEPLLTPILWTDIATGKLPEKHGFTRYFHTDNNIRTKRLWDILVRPDRPVGLWGWPVTWPPRPINGFIIPSLFARTDDTYPADLQFIKEFEKGMDTGWQKRSRLISQAMKHGLRPATVAKIGNYAVNSKLGKYNSKDQYIQPRLLKLDIHLDIYSFLVKKYRPYFTTFYFNTVDAFSHRFWRYFEPHLFPDVKAEDVQKYGSTIPQIYEKADQVVGRLLELTDKDTLVVAVSDHGFQAEMDELKGFYARVLGDKLLKLLGLEHEVQYVNYRKFVVLELAGKRPDIVEKLNQLQVKELQQPLLAVEEDVDGRVTIKLYETRGYKNNTREELSQLHIVWPGHEIPFLELIEPTYNRLQSGSHHIDGFGLFYGPGVKAGGCTSGSIIDVTPTILALLGMPVGHDMDGQILTEAIETEFLAQMPLTYIDTYDKDFEFLEEAGEAPESPELLNRLRALGYIE